MKASCRFCGLVSDQVATDEQLLRIKESGIFRVESREDADFVIACGFLQAHGSKEHPEEDRTAVWFNPPTLFRPAFPGAGLDEGLVDPNGCEVAQ